MVFCLPDALRLPYDCTTVDGRSELGIIRRARIVQKDTTCLIRRWLQDQVHKIIDFNFTHIKPLFQIFSVGGENQCLKTV
jgi:hypothetical protein